MSQSRFLRKYLGRPYFRMSALIWSHLLVSVDHWRPVRAYGVHLQSLMQLWGARAQYVGTFFFRNRPKLELMVRLIKKTEQNATLDLTVLGCSKGAEVYSISYAIRRARPDLKISLYAVDISTELLEFAESGVYSLCNNSGSGGPRPGSLAPPGDVAAITVRDQPASIFERMSADEMEAVFDRRGDKVIVKPQFREGIIWHLGDANDPGLISALGPQDIVVANRFLCHMHRGEAEACLRNLAQLVKPGGYLFVSGIDLDVRTKVAQELGWRPITEMITDIHEGDPSLRRGWPLHYWALEPLDRSRVDWEFRYASVFQLPPQ
jgi:SAM-dependent methyltransferase